MKILEMEDSEYEIHDVKEALKKRYDEIGNQQKMCDFLKKSFHEDSKEFAKVTKVECRILNDKLEVKYNRIFTLIEKQHSKITFVT